MRPIRLTLQAFGPFATREVVDFRTALEAGLFGVYGQTGAGKSTLFSAMSFALFGEPAKTDQEPRSLRSDHAEAGLPTEVEFVFELGQKTYLIRRRPAQERPKARGEGMTSDAAEASLFDATGIVLDQLGPDNSGDVIAEKKVSVVLQEVEGRLGYGADQFRQIVLLPQGKFETFLAAKTDARVQILRDLFDVKLYRDLAARLKDQAAAAEREVREQRAVYVARLAEKGMESVDALKERLKVAQGDVEAQIEARKAARAADQAAAQALAEAGQVAAAFDAVAEAQNAMNELAQLTPKIDALDARNTRVTRAMQARDLEQAWRQAERDLGKAEEAKKVADGALKEAIESREEAAKALAEERGNDTRREEVREALTHLEQTAKQVASASELETAFQQAQEAASQAQARVTEAESVVDNLKTQLETASAALDTARSNEATRGRLASALAETERTLVKAKAYEKAQVALVGAEGKVKDATATLNVKAEAAGQAEAALTEAETRLSRTQALFLAEKLVAGDPCPVCGGTDHPAPAHGTPEQSGLTEAFRKAERLATAARDDATRAEGDLRSYEMLRDDRKAALAELTVPERSRADLEAEKDVLAERLAALGPAVDLDALSPKLNELREKVTRAEAASKTAQDHERAASGHLADARANYQAGVQDLPDDLRTVEAVAARQEKLRNDSERLLSALETVAKAERAAGEALVRAEAGAQAAHDAVHGQSERKGRARAAFVDRLKEAEMNETTYAAQKVHFDSIEEDRENVATHRNALVAAETTLKNAQEKCAGHDRPDLAPLQEQRKKTEAALLKIGEDLAKARAEVTGLEAFQSSLADALEKVERLEAETGPLRGLANFVNGKNDYKMTLETFAIGAMFDEVLAAANLRLEPMTGGRYSLMRGAETTGGAGKRGLEIEVFDINTGKARPTATLSGGETFIAALALALGLADVVEGRSGKIRMDTIFIDEGFGSLDTENGTGTLDQVLQVLGKLTAGGRSVGLISHVGLVQEAIPEGFYVRGGPAGSSVEERRGL